MKPFNEPVDCGECGAQFIVDDSRIGSIKKNDLEVQYLSCPSCGAKYLIFVSDSKMRSLVERRKAIQTKIKAACGKKFQERMLKNICEEYDKIKKEQENMLPALRAAGEKILQEVTP